MTLLEAAALGAIQGLTEFLPISSSGHLVLLQHLLNLGGAENLTFDILLHVATLVAVVVYFRDDLLNMIRGLFKDRKQARLASLILVAMIPTGIIGLTIKQFIESAFNAPGVVGGMLLITGTLLYISPRLARTRLSLDGIRLRQALWVGTGQGIAALPGISRSGTTICIGMLTGVQAEAAARFSFLLAIPAILAATALDVKDVASLDTTELPSIGVGMVAAFLTGLISIRWLMRFARKGRFDGFAFYCWTVGAVTLIATLWQAFSS